MVWNQMKQQVARESPTTKEDLINVINSFWMNAMTKQLCNAYIDHIFKVAPICVLLGGRATGDIPNRLFPESSAGKSFEYFNQKLEHSDMREKAHMLIPTS